MLWFLSSIGKNSKYHCLELQPSCNEITYNMYNVQDSDQVMSIAL